jgi:hypothetical protein
LPNCLLKKDNGLPSYMSTAPILLSLASASRMKGLLKSGKANTGAEHDVVLILLKASDCGVDVNSPFFSPSNKGLHILP